MKEGLGYEPVLTTLDPCYNTSKHLIITLLLIMAHVLYHQLRKEYSS